jgi:hypothetical protein
MDAQLVRRFPLFILPRAVTALLNHRDPSLGSGPPSVAESGPAANATWPLTIPVLIPVYNHVRTVGQVVAGCRALGAQVILVIDDGSTDGSGEAAGVAGADRVIRFAPPCAWGCVSWPLPAIPLP